MDDPIATGGVIGGILGVCMMLIRLLDSILVPIIKTKLSPPAPIAGTSTPPSVIRSNSGSTKLDCEFDQGMRDKVQGMYGILDPKDPRSIYNVMQENLSEEKKQTNLLEEINTRQASRQRGPTV